MLLQALSRGLFEKEEILRLALLATIAGENLFLYGPTGIAKSMVARRLPLVFRDARSFEYLLGRFSTPEELFGPVSITQLKDHDRYERLVEGFLPAAEIVFLDEIWNASSPILNTLLTAINERRFRNGNDDLVLPLKTVIGAAGDVPPEDAALENLWDRFLLRMETTAIRDEDTFVEFLFGAASDAVVTVPETERITPDELDEWHDLSRQVSIPDEIVAFILDVRERISRHNRMQEDDSPITVSDRRWKQIIKLLRTSAFLNDRIEVDVLDCVLMRHCLWSRRPDREVVNTIVEEALLRYSVSGRFDAEAFRARLETTLTDVRSARFELHRTTSEKPLEYRGEYYRIVDFVEDHLTLMWIGDYQNLSTDRTTETDLFFYGDSEDYAYSERFPIRLIDPITVEIAEERFSVETVTVEHDEERPIELDGKTRADMYARLEALRTETNEVLEAIDRYRESSTGEAVAHLFVHRSYANIVTGGMDQAAREFAALQLDIDDALHDLG